jgi:enoyl-CoA hydratase
MVVQLSLDSPEATSAKERSNGVTGEDQFAMTDIIRSSRDGMVAGITIDRPEEGNLLTIEMVRALTAAFRAAADTKAKVIVLRSVGPDFCRGRDSTGTAPSPTALKMRANVCEPILDAYDAIANAPQPVVCVVQGVAHGFGCAIAGACDISIATDNARFKVPEMEKDLPPTLAISALMPRTPRKALTWMVYSTEELDASMALQFGIVSMVVPATQLDTALSKLLANMSARSAEALIAVKDFFRTASFMEPRGIADYACNLLASVLTSAGK